MAHFKVQFIEEKICYDIHATRHLCLMDHIRRARVSVPLFLPKEIYYLISHKSSDIVVTLILYFSLFIQRELRSFFFTSFLQWNIIFRSIFFFSTEFQSIQVKLHDTHLLYSTMSGRHMWSDGTWSICTLPVMCAANSSASCGGDRKDCINFFSYSTTLYRSPSHYRIPLDSILNVCVCWPQNFTYCSTMSGWMWSEGWKSGKEKRKIIRLWTFAVEREEEN